MLVEEAAAVFDFDELPPAAIPTIRRCPALIRELFKPFQRLSELTLTPYRRAIVESVSPLRMR